MKIIRFTSGDRVCLGQPIDEFTACRIDGVIPNQLRVTAEVVPVDKILSPIVPSDILCIGLNYREHAAESQSAVPANPMLFIKSGNTLNNPGDPIPIPRR